MGLIAPAHELVDARAGMERLHSRREELLTPTGPQGSQIHYLDTAIAMLGNELAGNDVIYGIKQSSANAGDDYIVGNSQLQAALSLTTGMYMANESQNSTPIIPHFSPRPTPVGYAGCSNGYDTC